MIGRQGAASWADRRGRPVKPVVGLSDRAASLAVLGTCRHRRTAGNAGQPSLERPDMGQRRGRGAACRPWPWQSASQARVPHEDDDLATQPFAPPPAPWCPSPACRRDCGPRWAGYPAWPRPPPSDPAARIPGRRCRRRRDTVPVLAGMRGYQCPLSPSGNSSWWRQDLPGSWGTPIPVCTFWDAAADVKKNCATWRPICHARGSLACLSWGIAVDFLARVGVPHLRGKQSRKASGWTRPEVGMAR